jgi:hypothetical protein
VVQEIAGRAHGRVGGDAAFLICNLADPTYGNVPIPRQCVDTDSQGAHEFLAENFAGMNRGQYFPHRFPPLSGNRRSLWEGEPVYQAIVD